MRVHMKRLVVLLSGGLAMTCFLLLLPNQLDEKDHYETHIKGEVKRPLGFLSRKLRKKSESNERYPAKQEPYQPKDSEGAFIPNLTGRTVDKELIKSLNNYLKHWQGIDARKLECTHNETIGQYWVRRHREEWPVQDSWDKFYSEIGSCDMYRPDNSPVVRQLLHDMATLPVKHVGIMDGGTQVKLLITYENGKQAVFKPMRFGRHYETDPNHFYFSDFERHFAELASYHLDKVLGLRHSVPLVGRVFNLSFEIRDKAEKSLARTFFISPAENLCFVSKCDYYCDTTHAICGRPDLKEGSLQVFLPDDQTVPRDHNRSPYRRTYSKKHQLAIWQKDPTFCSWKVKRKVGFAHGRRLLDLVELHVFDFLTGNQDRHHFETFALFDEYPAYMIFLDNGRGFGRPKQDDMSILAPLTQCCVIRPTLLLTLLRYYSGPTTLSEALYRSMEEDPVSPILSHKHYPALERRLEIILNTVLDCIQKNTGDYTKVIMTEYHNPEIPTGGGEEEEEEEED